MHHDASGRVAQQQVEDEGEAEGGGGGRAVQGEPREALAEGGEEVTG
jgi:hypothetical protein